jgi:hypothetical protein
MLPEKLERDPVDFLNSSGLSKRQAHMELVTRREELMHRAQFARFSLA